MIPPAGEELELVRRDRHAVLRRGGGPVLSGRHLQGNEGSGSHGQQILEAAFETSHQVPRGHHPIAGDQGALQRQEALDLVVAEPGAGRPFQGEGNGSRFGTPGLDRKADSGSDPATRVPDQDGLVSPRPASLQDSQGPPLDQALHQNAGRRSISDG